MALPLIAALVPALTSIITTVSSVSTALAGYAATVGPIIANIARTAGPIIKNIAIIANALLPLFNILKNGEKIDDMGERALQAAESGIEFNEFDDFDEYVEQLRNFKLDPEKAEKRDPIVQLVTGLGLGVIGLEEKMDLSRGSLNGLWLLPAGNEKYFTAERLESWLKSGQLVGDVFDYLNNQLSASDARDFEKKLETGMNESQADELYQALEIATAKIAELNNTSV